MGLNFLSKNKQTLKGLIAEIETISTRLSALRLELNDAKGATVAASEEAELLVFEKASAEKIEAAHHRLSNAEQVAITIQAVICRYETTLADKRSEHDQIVRGELAEKIAAENARDLTAYSEQLHKAVDALRDLIQPAEKIGSLSFAAAEIAAYATSLVRDLPLSLTHTEHEITSRVSGLRSGAITPSMPVEHAPGVATVHVEQIATKHVVLLTDAKWMHGTEAKAAAKGSQVDLPIATAIRAVAIGRAAESGTPAWLKSNRGSFVPVDPRAKGLLDLDADDLKRPQPVFGADQGVALGGIVETISYQR